MKRMPPPPRPRRTTAPSVASIAGLSADSLARLTPQQVSARVAAAAARDAAASRREQGRALSQRVAAVPRRPRAKPKPRPRVQQKAATPTQAISTPAPTFSLGEAALLVKFADAWDAGAPVPAALTPDEAAWAHRQGRRLRARRISF